MGFGRLAGNRGLVDGVGVGVDRWQTGNDAGPDGGQGLGGRRGDVAEASQAVQVVELPPPEELRLSVGEGPAEGGDADHRGEAGRSVAVVGEHRHHVGVGGRGGQAGLFGQLPYRCGREILRTGGLAAGQLPHAAGGAAEQNPPRRVGDHRDGAGEGVPGGRPLLGRGGVPWAGAAQDEDGELVRFQPGGLLPARGEPGDFFFVERDVAPLGRGVRSGGRDDHDCAAVAQSLSEGVQDAAAVAQERVGQAQGDQVIAAGVQLGRVVAFDVQLQPAHAVSVLVLRAGPGDRAVGVVDGVHRVPRGYRSARGGGWCGGPAPVRVRSR